MNRQELFHGNFHLSIVSRAEQGYRGASISIFPFFMSLPGDTFYLTETYDSIKNN